MGSVPRLRSPRQMPMELSVFVELIELIIFCVYRFPL